MDEGSSARIYAGEGGVNGTSIGCTTGGDGREHVAVHLA